MKSSQGVRCLKPAKQFIFQAQSETDAKQV